MSNKVLINLHPMWLERQRDKEEAELRLMERLKEIISGTTSGGPFDKQGGYKWQIDSSNDWWAEINPDGQLVLAYRYGKDRLEAVATWLRYYFKE